jgi:hypothetical protein
MPPSQIINGACDPDDPLSKYPLANPLPMKSPEVGSPHPLFWPKYAEPLVQSTDDPLPKYPLVAPLSNDPLGHSPQTPLTAPLAKFPLKEDPLSKSPLTDPPSAEPLVAPEVTDCPDALPEATCLFVTPPQPDKAERARRGEAIAKAFLAGS